MPPSVEIQIKAAVDQANASLQRVEKELEKTGAAGKSVAVTLKGTWTELNSQFNAIKATFGGVAAAAQTAFDVTVGRALAAGEALRDFQERTGATAEEAAGLKLMTDALGLSMNQLEAGIAAATRQGLEPNIAGLKELARQYAALPDEISKNAFLMKAFGRSGSDLNDILENLAAGGMQRYIDKAKLMGMANQEQIDTAHQVGLEWRMAKAEFEGVGTLFGSFLLPSVLAATRVTNDYAQSLLKLYNEYGLLAPLHANELVGLMKEADAQRAMALVDDDRTEAILRMRAAIDGLHDKNVTITVNQRQITIEEQNQITAEAYYAEKLRSQALEEAYKKRYGVGGQHGLDMVIPPGYPNDSFPIWASSGEGVHITPANQVTHNYYLTANYGRGESEGSLRDHMRILELLHG